MTEPIPNSEAIFVGIDPDSEKSGVAIWRPCDKRYSLNNLAFFELFEYLKEKKQRIRLVVIEAGWLNKSTWHGAHGKGAAISARITVEFKWQHWREINMCECEYYGRIIHDSDFNLTDDMNKKIVGFLRLKNNDVIAMYAAKLIEHYQCSIKECEARYVAGGESEGI